MQIDYTPNAVSPRGNYWLPAEPLTVPQGPLGVPPEGFAMRDLEVPDAERAALERRRMQVRDVYERNLELKVKQLLEHCRSSGVDVVVLPEYSLPASLVRVVDGFSRTMYVYAGLGRLRREDLVALDLEDQEEDLLHRNAAMLVGGGKRVVVTKEHLARDERAEPGSGIQFATVSKDGRDFKLALAICMDALHAGSNLNRARPDAILIAALTSELKDFYAAPPRGYARVIANHASFGGSGVVLPDVQGGSFVTSTGTAPLPSQEEGIVILDFDGFNTRPSSLQRVENRLVSQSSILYERQGVAANEFDAASLARTLGEWTVKDLTAGQYGDYLRQARIHLAQVGAPTVLRNCVLELERQESSAVITDEDFQLLTSHLVLSDILSSAEVRYQQLEILSDQFRDWIRRAVDIAHLGQYLDLLSSAMQVAAPSVRANLRSRAHRYLAEESAQDGTASESVTRFFSCTLGTFKSEEAVQTLPRQLAVLRTLSKAAGHGVRLVYRLSTVLDPTGDLVPLFHVIAAVRGASAEEVDELGEGIGQQLGATFSSAWSVSGTNAVLVMQPQFAVVIRRNPLSTVDVREDWAGLVDYLRCLRVPVSLQLTLAVSDTESTVGPTPAEGALASESTDGFLSPTDLAAAKFFARTSGGQQDEVRNLRLVASITADGELPATVLHAISSAVFGGEAVSFEPAETIDPFDESDGRLMTPSEALRVFHPPHGHIDGRGLSGSNPTSIPLPVSIVPSAGALVGSARSAFGRADRTFDVRLDEEARLRHAYVIGRTGSGKTNLLKLMARQDIESGRGVGVIDPHGDLVDYLLGHVSGREHEVLLLDFGQQDYTPVLNPLDLDVDSPAERSLAIEEFIQILVRQSFHQFYGPRFEDIVRLTLESITRPEYPWNPSVLDLVRILRTEERRKWLRNLLSETEFAERWRVFEQQAGSEIGQVLHWALSKFSEMSRDGVLSQVISGGPSTVSIRRTVQNGGILLVRLPEWELSASAAAFLGAFIQERVRRAVYERWRLRSGEGEPDPFLLYVDEFQTFATSGFEEMVAEARKFGLGLTLAHQNLTQLKAFSRFTGGHSSTLLDAVLGNIANIFVLGVSTQDQDVFAAELAVSKDSLHRIGQFSALARIRLNGRDSSAFTIDIPSASSDLGLPAARQDVVDRMINEGRWRKRSEISEEAGARELQMAELARTSAKPAPTSKSFLDDWLEKRADAAPQKVASTARPAQKKPQVEGRPRAKSGESKSRRASESPSQDGPAPKANRRSPVDDDSPPSTGAKTNRSGQKSEHSSGSSRNSRAASGDVYVPRARGRGSASHVPSSGKN